MIKNLFDTYNELYKNKGIIVKLLSSVFAIFSISTAHYLGYVSVLPMQIVISGGVDLLISVTKTFILYVTASAIIARIMAPLLATYFTIVNVYVVEKLARKTTALHNFIINLGKKNSSSEKKIEQNTSVLREKILATKQYKKNLIEDSTYNKIAQVILFIIIMLYGYFKPTYMLNHIDLNSFLLSFLVLLFFLIFALAFRTNFILLGCGIFKSRLKRKKTFFMNFATESLSFLMTLTIVISLLGGVFRVIYISSLPSVEVAHEKFNSKVKIIISNNNNSLYLEDKGKESRYIFFSSTGEVMLVKNEPSNAWLNSLISPN